MINDFFDAETKPLFDPGAFYGPKGDHADVCIIVLSFRIHKHLLENFDCKKCGEMTACNAITPIYTFTRNDCRTAFYLSAIGSAIASHQAIEANWLTGAEQFVMFGSAGSLAPEKTAGRYVVPTMAYRGEGLSYYYAAPEDYIVIRGAGEVTSSFDAAGTAYVSGPVWTTDAMYRETEGAAAARISEGCIAVDMELAGVQAVCDFHGWDLYDFLETGDILEEESYDTASLDEANHDLRKLQAAFDIIDRITLRRK